MSYNAFPYDCSDVNLLRRFLIVYDIMSRRMVNAMQYNFKLVSHIEQVRPVRPYFSEWRTCQTVGQKLIA